MLYTPLQHYCDVRSPVHFMTSSKLCTVVPFMKGTENIKNYCKTEIDLNSTLPRANHIIDGLWFIASQNTLIFIVVYPQKQKDTLIVNPPLAIIKLNMSSTATSSYLNLLPYYHNESKLNLSRSVCLLIILNLIIGLTSKFGKHSSQLHAIFTPKPDIPAVLKDMKDIPMRHLILPAYKSRSAGQISVPRWMYLATTIPTLTMLGEGVIAVYYTNMKNKCKKRSVKIYSLARNRGKTTETLWYNAVPVYSEDRSDVYMEEDNSIQHKKDSVVLTGVKQKQYHKAETKSAFPVLRQAPPVTTQV